MPRSCADAPLDLLRLAGPPGVGKSATAWWLARQLASEGERVAFVDIDQLGMCYPPPEGDPYRWRLKERALAAVAAQMAAHGARRLVVSGVSDPDEPPHAPPGAELRAVWLDAEADVRRRRLSGRGWDAERLDRVVATGSGESARLHAAWTRLSTDRLEIGDCATVVRRLGPTRHSVRTTLDDEPGRETPVLWITGPRCVGASALGWRLAVDAWSCGVRTAFVDLSQLSFGWNLDRSPGPSNLAALGRVLSAAGAHEVVVAAPLGADPDVAVRAGSNGVTVVRLDAAPAELRSRALARQQGDGAQLAGDDMSGAQDEHIDAVVEHGLRQRRVPLRPGERLLDSTTADPARLAALVRGRREPIGARSGDRRPATT